MKRLHLLFSLAVLFITACGQHETEHNEASEYKVSSALKKDTTIYKEYVSQINAYQHIEIRSMEKGYLQNIYVDEGQYVRKGQKLYQIMPVLYKAELSKAEAELKYAEIEYQNTKKLADQKVVSENELALAAAKLEKIKAELSIAKAHYNFTEIKAPFDGYIGRLEVRLGSLLDEGELLTRLSDNSKMWVYFNVPESEYLNYQQHLKDNNSKKVRLMLANNTIYNETGVIETIEADFNNETGNIAFRATFNNPKLLLRHGETGNVLVPVVLQNALLIPQKATFEVLDKKYVYVLDASNKIQSREIKVGAELAHLYEVVEGLNANDKILIEGLRKVKNNQVIKAKYEKPELIINELNDLHAE